MGKPFLKLRLLEDIKQWTGDIADCLQVAGKVKMFIIIWYM
jgi:hypothetical protein